MIKIGLLGQEREIQKPKKFEIDYQEISRTDRTASGRRVKDIIALKKVFTLTFDGMLPENMKYLRDLYEAGSAVNFIYEDADGIQSAYVDIVSIPRELFTYKMKYSQNITITLEEV